MELMMILFLHLLGYLFIIFLGIMWISLQAAIIRNLGIFGICLVSAIHILGPVFLLAALIS